MTRRKTIEQARYEAEAQTAKAALAGPVAFHGCELRLQRVAGVGVRWTLNVANPVVGHSAVVGVAATPVQATAAARRAAGVNR